MAKIEKKCYKCGSIFYIVPSKKSRKYCSNKCKYPKKITLNCIICNKIIKTIPSLKDRKKYCSSKCLYERESNILTKRWSKEQIALFRKNSHLSNGEIGKILNISLSSTFKIRKLLKIPPNKCGQKKGFDNIKLKEGLKRYLESNPPPRLGKKMSQKTREILRLKVWNNSKKSEWMKGRPSNKGSFTKERRKGMVLPLKNSSIEIKIQNFLKKLGIEFFTHQYMKIEHGYQCDIFVPEQNGIKQKTIIECDGDFIHCNPEKYAPDFVRYPNGKKIITAKEIWERDKIRTSELIDSGFKVLRLWEYEIRRIDKNGLKKILNFTKKSNFEGMLELEKNSKNAVIIK